MPALISVLTLTKSKDTPMLTSRLSKRHSNRQEIRFSKTGSKDAGLFWSASILAMESIEVTLRHCVTLKMEEGPNIHWKVR